MRNVLVTGGNGFIGLHVTRLLAEEGYKVDALDTRHRYNPNAFTILGDVRDATSVNEAVAHVDGVIHLAGVLGTQETIQNPRPAAETNILGGLNVFEACTKYDIPLVNIAVGNHWMNNTYSITKSTMERFAKMYNRERNARITVVRAMNAYGPLQVAAAPHGPSKVRKIMPSFVNRALDGDDIEVYGDGLQIMDMIYVEDVARVLIAALQATADGAILPVIEAGTGRRTTVNEIARTVIRDVHAKTGKRSEIVPLPMRPGEDPNSVVLANPDALELIRIDPASLVPLEAGVSRTVDYFRRLR